MQQAVTPSRVPASNVHSPAITIASHQRVLGLDLVRAAAILLVVIPHAVWSGAVAGPRIALVGVELFFVLSGFLIGGLLLDILSRGPTLSAWISFLARRWMRTIPLYVLWILVLLVVNPPAGDRAKYALMYLTFMQNFAWPMPNWFGVSWSLAVEEWFYLLFSAVLLGLAKFWPSKAVIATSAVFLVAPLVGRIMLDSGWADWDAFARKLMWFRLDSIAVGVVVVVLFRAKFDALFRWRHALLAIGLAVLLAAWFLRTTEPPVPLLRALIFDFYSFGCALILPAAAHWTRGPALLARPIQWLSERSYGLYVVHLTVIALAERAWAWGHLPAILVLPVAIAMSAMLADLSFRYFERPILRRRPKQL